MIEAKHVSKWFDGQRVLYDINATFDTGKTNLIIGQSGSGKTVFMKCLIGLLTPEEGEILYDGRKFRDLDNQHKRQLRTEIGMLFQGSALFDTETVLGNVMFPLKMFSNMSRAEQLERAHFCIKRVGLEKADDKYPSEISGGMQKRVAIARALVNDPVLILADEATGNLDTRTSFSILTLFQEFHSRGRTIVFVTHNPELAQYSSRNIVLRDGKIISDTYNDNPLSAREAHEKLPKEND